MLDDAYEGKSLSDPEVRRLFTREHLLASDWYTQRLAARQQQEAALWERHVAALEGFPNRTGYAQEAQRLGIQARLAHARTTLAEIQSPDYAARLRAEHTL